MVSMLTLVCVQGARVTTDLAAAPPSGKPAGATQSSGRLATAKNRDGNSP
jgi:hypothetical protein